MAREMVGLPPFLNPPPVPLQILFVTDGSGCYQPADGPPPTGKNRSLHEVINALGEIPGVTFTAKRAHRQNDPVYAVTADASLRNFNLTSSVVNESDEVWLFGVGAPSDGVPVATGAENTAIDNFMKSNRGVFATGDHWDLGAPLCSQIPRVRSMRKWGGAGTPTATGTARHDTRVKPFGESQATFDAELQNEHEWDDPIPQKIRLKLYGGTTLGIFYRDGFAHPLLCSSEGPINVLPDHMHEGSCVVPTPLPAEFGGVAPDVIAKGYNHAGSAVETSFGLIGVYDGEEVNLGRTVVDSTWHHFVWLNQMGYAAAMTDPGKRAWRLIRQYYRNLALWLAPAAKRELIAQNAFWHARWSALDESIATIQTRDTASLYQLGRGGIDLIAQITSNCWVVETLINKLKANVELHPIWRDSHLDEEWQLLPRHFFPAVAVGGILTAIHKAFPSVESVERRAEKLADELPKLVDQGIDEALSIAIPHVARSAKRLAAMKWK